MTTKPSLPVIPSQPATYDVDYINSLVNALRLSFNLLTNPGPLEGSSLNLSLLATSGNALRIGDVFNFNGYLKIVRANDAYPLSQSGTGSVGSVTVVV